MNPHCLNGLRYLCIEYSIILWYNNIETTCPHNAHHATTAQCAPSNQINCKRSAAHAFAVASGARGRRRSCRRRQRKTPPQSTPAPHPNPTNSPTRIHTRTRPFPKQGVHHPQPGNTSHRRRWNQPNLRQIRQNAKISLRIWWH